MVYTMSIPFFTFFQAVPCRDGLFCAKNATLRSGKVLYFATLSGAENHCAATLCATLGPSKCALIPEGTLDTVTKADKMARKESVLHRFPIGRTSSPVGESCKTGSSKHTKGGGSRGDDAHPGRDLHDGNGL